MVFIKSWYHIMAFVQRLFLYLLYGTNIKIGKRTTWRKGFSVMKNGDAQIKIGENCFFNNYCSINANDFIEIGNGSIFGENVKIYDHNHRFNQHKEIKQQGFSNAGIRIGQRCWIGSNVTILKGTEIGNNCVVGAGCVISGKIPDDSIVKYKQKIIIDKILYKDDEINERD